MSTLVVGALVGFALGSIPSGYLLVRLWARDDIRAHGSGNIGATNVGRTLGRGAGVLTLAADAGKGVAGVLAATALGGGEAAAAAAASAVLGHCYTPWLGFRGGKGVATMLGSFGFLMPWATAISAAALALLAALTRTMSAGSLAAAIALPLAAWWLGEPPGALAAAALVTLVVGWRHRGNVGRLLAGTERRFGERPR